MYSYNVSAWKFLPLKMKDALNCVATLNCLEAFGRLPNATARAPVMDHVEAIRNKFHRSTLDEFEANQDVVRRLDFAKDLTEQVKKMERGGTPTGELSPRSKSLSDIEDCHFLIFGLVGSKYCVAFERKVRSKHA